MFKQLKRLLGKSYRTIKIFNSPTKNIIKGITETIKDVGSQYPPQVRNILLQHGNHKITRVRLCREVVSGNTEFLLKALAGKNTWEEAKKKYGFDKFYHLFMIVTMGEHELHIEKNEVVRISPNPRPCPEALDLGPVEITLNSLMERTRQRIGDNDFFVYDPFSNNCQAFIKQLLITMRHWNNTSKDYVFQDIEGLRNELPSYAKTIAKGLTNVGAFLNTAYQKTKDYIENGESDEGLDNQTDAS